MIIKLLILGVLSNTAIQAFPSEEVEAIEGSLQKEEKTCEEKIEWYRNTTEKTKEYLDKYEKLMKEHPLDNHISNDINAEQDMDSIGRVEKRVEKFKQKIADTLNKYSEGASDMANVSNTTARLVFCREELKWSNIWHKNLTNMATDVKKDVMNVLKFLDVPKHIQESFDKALSRIVNFLFLIEMSKNLFKDIKSLVEECSVKTELGIALEENYQVGENGDLVEFAQELNEDYKDAMDNNVEDNELTDDLINFEDDTEIRDAMERKVTRTNDIEHLEDEFKSEPYEESFKFEEAALLRG